VLSDLRITGGLKGMPTAMVTVDDVSDRGPQFISQVLKAFFKLQGVTVSLSSGYHPHSNRQTERKIQEIPENLLLLYSHQNFWNQFLD